MSQEKQIQARGKEIYDELMEFLGVPELKTDSVATLEEQFTNESPIDRAARHERYEAALDEADRLMELESLGIEYAKHAVASDARNSALAEESKEQQSDIDDAAKQLESIDETT